MNRDTESVVAIGAQRWVAIADGSVRATHTIMVELTGIEPVASWLQTRRSPS